MKINPGEFSKMTWKVYHVKNDKELDLSAVPSFSRVKADRLATIKYMAYLYDAESPFNKRIPDVAERKREAAILAGFDLTTAAGMTKVNRLYLLSDEMYRDIVVDMLRFQRNKEFTQLISLETFFDECTRRMLQPLEDIQDGKNSKLEMDAVLVKSKISDEMQKTSEKIDILYRKLFCDDPAVKKIVAKIVQFSPEGIADQRYQ